MLRPTALAAFLTLAVPLSARQASDASTSLLRPGMAAPALEIEKWVKGAPVPAFERGKVYVIEFWATWCPPCIASMPHLSALQRQYGKDGVTIIGVTSADPRNSLERVEKMVADKGDQMAYTVAWDEGRATSAAYMEAAGQNGIPCSFVVDPAGKVAYIGHPMFLDEPLAELRAGTWDSSKDPAQLEQDQDAFFGLYATLDSDPKGTLVKLRAFEERHPALASLTGPLHLELALSAAEYTDAWATGAAVVERASAAQDAEELNHVAWIIVDPARSFPERDLALAKRAAEKAVELTSWKDATLIDTLARVHATSGDLAKAIELQTLAIEAASEKQKLELVKTLGEYRSRVARR